MVENNHWDAPITPIQQGSISKAAIVYEAQVEQITRNMFIFMDLDDVDNITPIRSCRSYFVSTALSYDAIFAHCGFSADGLGILRADARESCGQRRHQRQRG